MKKITLLILFCFCAVGFSQAQIAPENSGTSTSNDTKSVSEFKDVLSLGLERNAVLRPKKTVQHGEMKDVFSLGLERNAIFNSKEATSFRASEKKPFVATLLERTLEMEAEILASENWLATQPTNSITKSSNVGFRNSMADIIPAPGATETFVVVVGDNFFDPGGPGPVVHLVITLIVVVLRLLL